MSEGGIHVAVARARAGMVTGPLAPAVAVPAAELPVVLAALGEVMDPELPMVSIVDLGMVGDVAVDPGSIRVELLPTFVGCPALELIRSAVIERLAGMAGAGQAVEVVATFAVPWTSERITRGRPGRPGHGRHRAAGRARRRPLPVLRRRAGRHGQRLRADAVPLAVLLPRLPPAVRSHQARLTVGASSSGTVGIVGAGRMGAGIAQVAIEAGHDVVLEDAAPLALERGVAAVRTGLGRRAARLDLDPDSIDDWVEGRIARLRPAATIADLAGADLVIEAAAEDLAVKRGILAALDRVLAPGAIVATNTSALSVAAIASGSARPDRVLGLHFFNPAPLMALVEVVAAPTTDPAVADRAAALMTAWGKTPVRAADTPGFIVNRVNRPFTIEALRMLEAGDAGVEVIDDAMRAAGFPMGPFELMDLTGIDVTLAAARSIWERLGRPDRLRPSPIQERLVADGHLGRSTGQGFYRYPDGTRGPVASDVTTADEGSGTAHGDAAIVARILGAVDGEARRAVAEGVASAPDIDLALRLGAGHPQGPFERSR